MAAAGKTKNNAKQKGSQAKGANAKGNASPRALRANQKAQAEHVEPIMDAGSGRDIAGVLLAVFAVASFISVVSPSSAPVTAAIAGFYHLGFGLGAYVVPLCILGAAAALFWRGPIEVSARTCVGVALIFVSIVAVLSLSVPYTELSASAMFEPENLSAYGGYVGAFLASVLQNALGKTIAYVVLVGLIILGFVLIGFSIGDVVRSIAQRAEQIAQRRRVDVNERPWGDDPSMAAPVARAAHPAQASLFDEAGSAPTTYLGSRVAPVERDMGPDNGEDPFVDVSAEVASEHAKTTLIPVKERFATGMAEVDAVPPVTSRGAAPTRVLARDEHSESDAFGSDDDAIESSDALPWDEPSDASDEMSSPISAPAATAVVPPMTEPPVPEFLRRVAEQAKPTVASEHAKRPASATKPAGSSKPQGSAASGSATAAPAGESPDGERQLPPISMLRHNPASASSSSSEKELEQTAAALQATLQEFGLHSRVVGWISGPTVTTFKVQPGEGERVSRISNLEDDIALSLATDSVRIFAPIPGTSLVGIEIPNRTRQTVAFGDILPYVKGGPLEFALGRDAEGQPMVADLAKMPHLLIAGTTGSGKSVVISSILMSLLMRTFPEDVRLIMIDPKRVEFAPYDGLPHLYVPVVTEPKQAASALQWAVSEMERRLKIFERIGVRKISTFNEKQAAGEFEKYDNPPAKMPYLVIVIDELSDLMMVAGKDVEASIVRIAQLGRAAGIHMIVATQRPSSNVVTGLIKANITNRIGLTVATGIDSRVILDQTGAEKLIGQGDMLFSRVDWGKPKRIQGCYVSDEEIFSVVEFVKEQSPAEYHEEILSAVAPAMVGGSGSGSHDAGDDDPLLWDAARIVVESQLGSTSGLQRRLKVGYARAGRIMDMLEEKGVVGPPDGSKPREVLLDEEGLAELEALEARMAQDDELGGF
ncbi:DNA translocase FtsK 4TM domain-containing protein [Collinsella tanakaei]|uniref:FtsK/SpoIIIE family DNA translocase n=1 Tax=Collinsella tanakaei TaxID=626935 RepID=UPI003F4E84EC